MSIRMKTILSAVLTASFLCSLEAIELLNPAKPIPEYSVVAKVLRKQEAEITKAPDGVPAVKLSWNNADSNKMEFFFAKGVNIPEFKKAVMKVRVYLEKESFCRYFSIRLIDNQSEIFQFQKFMNFDTLKPGWHTFEYTIDPETFETSPDVRTWGRNVTKKLEYPVSLFGFCIDFAARLKNGFLYIGNVDVEIIK